MKHIKILLAVIVVLLVVIGGFLIYKNVIEPRNQQEQAQKAMEQLFGKPLFKPGDMEKSRY